MVTVLIGLLLLWGACCNYETLPQRITLYTRSRASRSLLGLSTNSYLVARDLVATVTVKQ